MDNNKILEEKLSSYPSSQINNFVVSQELTVTITLREYRELVENKASADKRIHEEYTKRIETERENKELRKRIEKRSTKLLEDDNTEEQQNGTI